jgi:hypothetical protein
VSSDFPDILPLKASKYSGLIAVAVMLLGSGLSWADGAEAPAIGSYGFDWLHPKSAKCTPVTDANRSQFSGCEFKAEGGSFGLGHPYHLCRPRQGVEFFVYRTKPECTEAKETMDANAP